MDTKVNKVLLVVDVQRDFCPGGTLAVPRGNDIIQPINNLLAYAEQHGWKIVASRDWHPEKTAHFDKWPVHCVQNTPGAEFHPDLQFPERTVIISKGMDNKDDGYSLFEGVKLRENDWPISAQNMIDFSLLQTEVYVTGLATDYCVKATALDAVKLGYKTFFVIDACKAVSEDTDREAQREMHEAGVKFVHSVEVLGE